MTGFGRASFEVSQVAFEIELRCVNHRYLDVRVRLPRQMSAFESDLRAAVAGRFARGKVDCNVSAQGGAALEPRVEIDVEVARQYLRAAAELAARDRVPGALDLGTLLGLPGVARTLDVELPEQELRERLMGACSAALAEADAMRCAEGANLERELLARIEHVAQLAGALEARADAVQAAVRERLRKRSQQLAEETGLFDEARLHQEIVLAADRLDVTEELVRVRSHRDQFREIVASAGPGAPVGRRLEFLLQELAREVNTLGSKGADTSIAHAVVELKSELERLREQVQNVE
jgi:uncharacterized protein (TIGR00255 family)